MVQNDSRQRTRIFAEECRIGPAVPVKVLFREGAVFDEGNLRWNLSFRARNLRGISGRIVFRAPGFMAIKISLYTKSATLINGLGGINALSR